MVDVGLTGDLNATGYLISILGDALPVALVPAVVFVLAAITAFSTGTSWGTMAILIPLVLPLAWAVMTVNGIADPSGMHIMYSSDFLRTRRSRLGGSLFTDFRHYRAVFHCEWL